MQQENFNFLRYPGGKQHLLTYLLNYLPNRENITGQFVEPFVGGGHVFFGIDPSKAMLADINKDLIELYQGIQQNPKVIWEIFNSFPSTKEGYYEIRSLDVKKSDLSMRAAKTLYLNRTCFKGMWRQNAKGDFNVGYGGQSRRWVITEEILTKTSKRLQTATLLTSDFETVINNCKAGDFIFLDPPYRPHEPIINRDHYSFCKFDLTDHRRLANCLRLATDRGISWAMTTSSHPQILEIFNNYFHHFLPKGTGKKPGNIVSNHGEVLICNYEETIK